MASSNSINQSIARFAHASLQVEHLKTKSEQNDIHPRLKEMTLEIANLFKSLADKISEEGNGQNEAQWEAETNAKIEALLKADKKIEWTPLKVARAFATGGIYLWHLKKERESEIKFIKNSLNELKMSGNSHENYIKELANSTSNYIQRSFGMCIDDANKETFKCFESLILNTNEAKDFISEFKNYTKIVNFDYELYHAMKSWIAMKEITEESTSFRTSFILREAKRLSSDENTSLPSERMNEFKNMLHEIYKDASHFSDEMNEFIYTELNNIRRGINAGGYAIRGQENMAYVISNYLDSR